MNTYTHTALRLMVSAALILEINCAVSAMAEVVHEPSDPKAVFAAKAVQAALASRQTNTRVVLKTGATHGTAEGFSIRRENGSIIVSGTDSAGLMYGGLEVAETIRAEGAEAVAPGEHHPRLQMRGVKFNIPLDARTPSYSDMSDAAQHNLAEVWDMAFWKEFIDTLAEYRYNYVSLWNLHPFPSLVKVPGYEDIALDDVKRSRGPFEESYSLNGVGLDAPKILSDMETVKTLTIDEKVRFWREVMAYGKTRNVDFYIVTWNIFTCGTGGKHGITDDIGNAATRDYFRKSVEQLLLTYPDLAGIGLTTGEKMPKASSQAKEDWAFETYGQGVLDALKKQPGRKFRFIHRQHQTGETEVLSRFQPLREQPGVDFIFSFKYAQAHVYSETRQPFCEKFVGNIEGRCKTIWELRNDDVFFFRWAAPDFVREFFKNLPDDVTQGYCYGSDNFIWGREFLGKDAEPQRPLEIKKHWLQWMLWGRLAYDPAFSNQRIEQMLAVRFPEADGRKLLTAWQSASMVYPLVTGFHWGALDFQWYIEGCRSQPVASKTESGFHDVESFIRLAPHKNCETLSIPRYVASLVTGDKPAERTPLALADKIETNCKEAETALASFGTIKDTELRRTLDDIRIVCAMGRYYAAKIRGATYVALCRKTGAAASKQAAVEALSAAVAHWKKYAEMASANYKNPLWTNRVGNVDWHAAIKDAEHDVAIANHLEVKQPK